MYLSEQYWVRYCNHTFILTRRSSGTAQKRAALYLYVSGHDNMPSAGFLIIAFAAAILVMVPSVVSLIRGWRSGNLCRVFSVFSLLLFIALGWSAFTDTEYPDFESRAIVLFAVWGVIFYSGVGIYLCFRVVSGFIKRRHA